MGTHYGGNGGDPPPDGDRHREPDLPPLPPEWGDLTIPDDASALAEEAEQVRRELAREPATRPGRRFPTSPRFRVRSALGAPLLMVAVAVAITLASLIVMGWSSTDVTRTPPEPTGRPVPAVTLTDHSGRPVPLAEQAPMVLLLVEDCACERLIGDTAAAAPSGVRVVTVGHSPPGSVETEPGTTPPLRLADPNGLIRAGLQLGLPAEAAATVVLVDPQGRIAHAVPSADSLAPYHRELADLAA